ncbi:hypothetical protein BC828DRAFT_393919 [Blastocladiella britannica]|nr:hypothetical protein BC828DRAFT_393919 [Blastocladiella britannica]
MDIPLVVLDQSRLLRIVESGSLSLREWCWNAAVRTLGLSRASRLLTDDLVNAMCVHGRADFLNWLWDLIVHQMRKAHVLQNWHPQCPFMCLNVIHWWESKVATCAVDLAAFDLQPTPNDAPKLDALFANPYPHRYEPVSVIELGTWIGTGPAATGSSSNCASRL